MIPSKKKRSNFQKKKEEIKLKKEHISVLFADFFSAKNMSATTMRKDQIF